MKRLLFFTLLLPSAVYAQKIELSISDGLGQNFISNKPSSFKSAPMVNVFGASISYNLPLNFKIGLNYSIAKIQFNFNGEIYSRFDPSPLGYFVIHNNINPDFSTDKGILANPANIFALYLSKCSTMPVGISFHYGLQIGYVICNNKYGYSDDLKTYYTYDGKGMEYGGQIGIDKSLTRRITIGFNIAGQYMIIKSDKAKKWSSNDLLFKDFLLSEKLSLTFKL